MTATLPPGVAGSLDVDLFGAADGTLYVAVGVTLASGSLGAGVQVTSVAIADTQLQQISEAVLAADPVSSSFAGVEPGRLWPLDRIRRTGVVRDLAAAAIVRNDPPSFEDGEFDAGANGGCGVLHLPLSEGAGSRTVSACGVATEPLFALGADDGEVPAAVTTGLRRRVSGTDVRVDTIAFPRPVAVCVGGDQPGAPCAASADCGGTIFNPGRCGRASASATCGGVTSVPCDPRSPGESVCGAVGLCPNLGGEAIGQSISFDDTVGSRVGDEASQPDGPDGFLLRSGRDMIVFVVMPSGSGGSPQNAAAAGFVASGVCAERPGAICNSDENCAGVCLDADRDRINLGAIGGSSAGLVPVPNTPTSTPTFTPTATPTITPTPTNTPTVTPTPTPTGFCGDAEVDVGEDCDDAGLCVGGTNAGSACAGESECVGNGACVGGGRAGAACAGLADCPEGVCRKCLPFGGDGCAANCTSESEIAFDLVSGLAGSVPPGTSGLLAYIGSSPITVPFQGSLAARVGAERNGRIPIVLPATSLSLPGVDVSGISCVCVRGVAAKTCGGTLLAADGVTLADDCTRDESVCAGQAPCAFVHGPGNMAAGEIGCDGLAGSLIDVELTGESLVVDRDDRGAAVPGEAILLSSLDVGAVFPSCTGGGGVYGDDGTYCTADDPFNPDSGTGTSWTTTATACGTTFAATTVGPHCRSGAPASCADVGAGSLSGTCFVLTLPFENFPTLGPTVQVVELCAE